MRKLHARALAVAGLLTLAGCGDVGGTPPGGTPDTGGAPTDPCAKKLADGDAVSLTSRLLDAGGAPVGNTELGLWSASLLCIDPGWLVFGMDSPDATATSAADGTFAFSRTGRDTKSVFGTDLCFTVRRRNADAWGVFEHSGRTRAQFYVKSATTEIPELRDWDEHSSADTSADPVRFSWNALGKTHPWDADGYTVGVLSAQGEVWRLGGLTTPSATLPRYLLEDFSGLSFGPSATAHRTGSCTTFDLLYGGTGATFTHPAPLAPPSRGATCSTDKGTLATPCPFTDGKLAIGSFGSGEAPTWLQLTLASPRVVRRAVLRQLKLTSTSTSAPLSVVLDTSADGVTWVGTTSLDEKALGDWLEVPLGEPVPALHVRVRVLNGTLSGLAEVSLFE